MPSVMTEPAEPRRYRRFPVQFTAEISGGAQLMVCEASDIGAGGCCATVLFPLQRGQEVRVRLRSDRVFVEPAGAATVAWTSRTPPYKVGLAFSPALAEAAVPFLQGLLGPVKLTTGRG